MTGEIFVVLISKESCGYGRRAEKIKQTKIMLGIGILIPASLGQNSSRPVSFYLEYNADQFFKYQTHFKKIQQNQILLIFR